MSSKPGLPLNWKVWENRGIEEVGGKIQELESVN